MDNTEDLIPFLNRKIAQRLRYPSSSTMTGLNEGCPFFNLPSIGKPISLFNLTSQVMLIVGDIEYIKLCLWEGVLNHELLINPDMSSNDDIRVGRLFLHI